MSNVLVVRNIGQLLTMRPALASAADAAEAELGLIRDAALVAVDGRVTWVGREADLPTQYGVSGSGSASGAAGGAVVALDAGGRVVLPGLVECHTHLVFAGDRAREFELRSQGATYEEIWKAGGGILSTVRATREAGEAELEALALERLARFLEFGVTTVEAKSGYGLDLASELKLLRVADAVGAKQPVTVVPTFLGAHVVGPELASDRAGYVDLVCNGMIPEVACQRLARFCDVFCENGAFSVEESRRILEAGRLHGLLPKIHAEQLSGFGGARLAAELGCVSADHLDFAGPADAEALARSGTTAVLLPGATLFTGKKRFADARLFAAAGCRVALSTDFNPGSSHTQNLWLMGTVACAYMGMRPSAALAAMTTGAAAALRMQDDVGHLGPGARADLLVLDDSRWEQVLYLFGRNPVKTVVKDGKAVWGRAG